MSETKTETTEAPEQESAATLEEAMAKQDSMAREANEELTEKRTSERREAEEDAKATAEELGAEQEARDDKVYGRVPGAEDRRPGIGDTTLPEGEKQVAKSFDAQAHDAMAHPQTGPDTKTHKGEGKSK
jgi:hypothetical protein